MVICPVLLHWIAVTGTSGMVIAVTDIAVIDMTVISAAVIN